VKQLLEVATAGRQRATVYSDDHRIYPRALGGLACDVAHQVTSSREHRGADNPLFEVNLTDLLIRHCSANHKRETIAWSKRRQASAERLAVFLVWRNYVKGRREKVRGSPTPAMARGLLDQRFEPRDILARRLFPSLIALPGRWREYYERRVRTRALGRQREHGLKYAV
jgi:hypothetical protein